MVGVPKTWAADNPTQIRFIVSHADCGGTGKFEFFVSGISVGVYSSTQGCVCNSNPLVVTLNDPFTLSLIEQVSCTPVSMTLTDPDWGLALGYVRVEIDRTESGTETFCLVDYLTGGTCGDRNLCNGYNFPGTSSYSNIVDCVDTLKITPVDGLVSNGFEGGPFTPASKNYTLKNNSPNPFDWTAEVNVPWLNVSPISGTLASGQSTAVTVSINANANSLPRGSYNGGVKFTNLTSGINQLRSVSLMFNKILYVDPNGTDTTNGGTTIDNPLRTIDYAVYRAAPGDIIYVRGGTYTFSDSSGAITLPAKSRSSSTNRCKLFAYQNERPLLDFSAMTGTGADGIRITGNYWYVKGMDCFCAPHSGIRISGSYNIAEFCRTFENRNSGVQLNSGASYNQIINCDSYYNRDPGDQDADGFSPKMDVGTGNSFYGCRSWQNSDDGYDGYLRGTDDVNTTTYENCWAFKNGYLKDGTMGNGNGNGFKMGGSDNKLLRHNVILKNCLSFNNKVKGFDENSNKGSMTLYNCTAFGNSENYRITTAPAIGKTVKITNCVCLGTGEVSLGTFVVQTTNSWMSPFVVTNADFVSIDPASAYGPRKPDGSLPDIAFMHLVTGSDLIDVGTDVNLPYNGSKPDLGCFEYVPGGSPPGAASSPTPADLATDVSRTQDLSWTAGSGTPSHDVYFGTVDPPPFIKNQTGITYDTGTMIGGITYYWRIDEKNAYDTTTGPVWSFVTVLPPLPGAATNPTPIDGATDIGLTQDLSWRAGGEATSHDVYFGTDIPPSFIGNQTAATYDTGTMASLTTYYWRIDEKNARGTTIGTVWNFTVPQLSGQATNPSPSDGATDVNLTQALSWTADSNATSHDVYFGTTSPPPFQVNQTSTTYDTGTMDSLTTYYWRIDERNAIGPTTGTIWNFTTQDTMPPTPDSMTWAIEPNAISGSSITMTATTVMDDSGVEYYFANITDPNHDSGWVASPSWTDTGLVRNTTYTYIVIARDKSSNQNETGWSGDANATTLRYNCSETIGSDLDNNCKVDFLDYALMTSHWNEALLFNNDIAVNGTFDTDIIPGWEIFDLPSAEGTLIVIYDGDNGDPVGSGLMGNEPATTGTSGHYFYQVLPVDAGKQYKLSAEWMGDISSLEAPDPCNHGNWAEVLVAFETNADANTWTVWTDPNAVMYRKAFGVVTQNIDSSGTWPWEPITASQTNGPADGVFTANGDYMVVAFSEGSLPRSGLGYFYTDNVKVKGPGCSPIDLNADCYLDWLDIEQFATDWLTCNRDPAEECRQ
jgi:hypothetical protein